MLNVYAKIQSGTVINMQMCQSTDYFDPQYTWVIITTQLCEDGSPIQIGCIYDGTNFNPPIGD